MNTYTTPTYIYTVTGIDFADVSAAYVSIKGTKCEVHKNTVDQPNQVVLVPADNQIACYLTQEETAQLGHGLARHQVNFITTDGTRVATKIQRSSVGANLYREVI